MTLKELLNHQRETAHVYLIRQGLFFRGYNESALLLHELLGYQIKCKESKSCGEMLYYVGFPASVIDKVVGRMIAGGGKVEKQEEGGVEISGIASSLGLEVLSERATPGVVSSSAKGGTVVASGSNPSPNTNPNSSQSQSPNHSHSHNHSSGGDFSSIADRVRMFDVLNRTPLESLQFIIQLQHELR